jgi:hypothetical protein
LLAIAVLFQGPGRAVRQLFDVPGHVGLVVAAARRTRHAGWMIAVVIGTTVVSWTGSQGFAFRQESARGDVLLLTHTRGPVELTLEQGVLAALTPLRDVAGLASNMPLLVLIALLLFRATAGSWGAGAERSLFHHPRPGGWASVGWMCGALYVLYRLVALAAGSPDLPLGGCLTVESLIVPTVMVLADGILLAWVLVALRHAGFETRDGSLFDVREAAGLMPAAALACLAILPARYVATLAVLLAWACVPDAAATTPIGQWVRWQLSWGLADLQAAALIAAGVAGAVAWSCGSIGEALRGYARMLSAHGARLVVVFFLGGLGSAAGAAVAYLAILSLPASTWVLAAADSYAHYVPLRPVDSRRPGRAGRAVAPRGRAGPRRRGGRRHRGLAPVPRATVSAIPEPRPEKPSSSEPGAIGFRQRTGKRVHADWPRHVELL